MIKLSSACMVVPQNAGSEHLGILRTIVAANGGNLWPLVCDYGPNSLRTGPPVTGQSISTIDSWTWPGSNQDSSVLHPQIRYANAVALLEYVATEAEKYAAHPVAQADVLGRLLTTGILRWAAKYIKENKIRVDLSPCTSSAFAVTTDYPKSSSLQDVIKLESPGLNQMRARRASTLLHETRHWDNLGSHNHLASGQRDLRWVYQNDADDVAFAYSVENSPYIAFAGEQFWVQDGMLHNIVQAEVDALSDSSYWWAVQDGRLIRSSGAFQFQATFLANLLAVAVPGGPLSSQLMSTTEIGDAQGRLQQILNSYVVPPNFTAASAIANLPPFQYW